MILRWTVAFSFAFILVACGDEPAKPQEPSDLAPHLPKDDGLNVLVISFDALRADALGLYGYERPTSPNLDTFANISLVFDRAYAAAPVTPTSFAAAFTGQHPFRVFHRWRLLDTETMAKAFERSNRRTFALLNNTQLAVERNFAQGFDDYRQVQVPDEDVLIQAFELLDDHAESPFFGWIHFISPHTPYIARDLASHFYRSDYEGEFMKSTGGSFQVANDSELERARNLYDGQVFFADLLFSQLMKKLRSLGLLENTVIVVTADHGEEFMEHGQLQHNSQYEEVIRTPLMIYHPGVRKGARTQAPFVNTDLFPTLASVAGVPYKDVGDGLDLTLAYREDRALVSTGMTHQTRREISLTQGHKKLIVMGRPEVRHELYDLAEDPGEKTNVFEDQRELGDDLFSELETITFGDPWELLDEVVAGTAPTTGLTEDQIAELKALGYITDEEEDKKDDEEEGK